MSHLFEPLKLRGVTLRNRIGVSPMCQYSSVDGHVNAWHLVHLGSRAVGGAGLVLTEGTAITPEGRITPSDLGLWSDAHVPGHRQIASFVASQGAVPGIQLAHAGRKASRVPPWETDPSQTQGRPLSCAEGGWKPQGASAIAFDRGYTVPGELTQQEIAAVVEAFRAAALRADAAGYQWIEIHAAHGYLLHSFASPIANGRSDGYGGSLANRCRITREVARAVRAAWPEHKVLAFRLSYTDWAEGGWELDDTVQLASWLRHEGVDLIDLSSGGNTRRPAVTARPGYQVPGAEAVRRRAELPTAAVGWIDDPEQADAILREGRADMVMLARELLRDPYWPQRAALRLKDSERARLPVQYSAAWAHLGPFSYDPISTPQISVSGNPAIDGARRTVLA
ncbi:MAG TPA: NADH:flavin oxidoreductase/NADH oxidase [Ramlibacter sp.]|nr:NADH:flavin oxidoreductase/NADH oxidase [Ramlibacter sp.]